MAAWLPRVALLLAVIGPGYSIGAAAQDASPSRPSVASPMVARNAGAGTRQVRVALVVGNSGYETLPRVANAASDAQEVCKTLRSLQFDALCAFDLPDRLRVRAIEQAFLKRTVAADLVLFYFAGYATQIEGRNYLLPTKVAPLSPFDLKDEGLPLDALVAAVRGEAKAQASLVAIVDAAENPAIVRSIEGVTAGLAKPPTLVGSTVIVLSSGLPAAAQGAERVEFTRELLHDFSEPGITVDEALARTRDALVNGSQVEAPFIVGSLGRRLCLAGCERADSSALAKELNRQLDDAMSRIRELESERVTNADEQRRSAERIAALEREVRLREAAASATTERDRRKDAELADLRQKLEHERSNQRRLDEMGVVVQKAKALEDANFALSKEKQDAASRIAALQADIDARSRAAGQAGEANLRSQDEIARLRRELDDARLKQRDLQGAEARAKANQDEISTLRATIAELRTEQAKREREFVEQQRARDDELRRLQQAVRDRGNSQPRPGADRSNPPPIPAGF